MTVKAKKQWYCIDGGKEYTVLAIRNGDYLIRWGKDKTEQGYYPPDLFEVVAALPRPPCNTIQHPSK